MQPIAGGALARPFVDASQRARHRPLPADRAGAVSQAADGRRHRDGSSRSIATSGTRASRPSTIPSSRCSSSTEAYVDYQRLMTLTEEMLSTVAQQVIGTTECAFGDHTISSPRRFGGCRCGTLPRKRRSARLGVTVTVDDLRDRSIRPRDRGLAWSRTAEGRRRRQDRQCDLRGAVGKGSRAAHLRVRFPDRSVAAVEADARTTRTRSSASNSTSADSRWPTRSAS